MTPKIKPAEVADRYRQKRTSGPAQDPFGHADALLPDPSVSPRQSLARMFASGQVCQDVAGRVAL